MVSVLVAFLPIDNVDVSPNIERADFMELKTKTIESKYFEERYKYGTSFQTIYCHVLASPPLQCLETCGTKEF